MSGSTAFRALGIPARSLTAVMGPGIRHSPAPRKGLGDSSELFGDDRQVPGHVCAVGKRVGIGLTEIATASREPTPCLFGK
jgi:hypothetical protein